jgi:hypothetical protein
MVTLATLMFEVLLTRIFSVTMWYHYAFVAVSVAMFGMTVGAIIVYLLPNYFTQQKSKYHLALNCLLFSLFIIVSFLIHISIPFLIHKSIGGLIRIALIYVVISIPFIFSGICVTLALTKFPANVSKLYTADLAGAALGCILLIFILNITDAPTAVFVVAFLASVGGMFFLSDVDSRTLRTVCVTWCILLGIFAAFQTYLVFKESPLLRLKWVKGQFEAPSLYEKWNSFSRVRVYGNMAVPETPSGWGLSSAYANNRKIKQLYMDIDANAATLLTAFDGDLTALDHLKYDVTNVAHYISPNSKVLVIGTGGGRDILSALVFNQKSVLGVEINQQIIDAVNIRFGNFTGHLDRDPRVKFINDEARSYIARSSDQFDIIQVSLIDTWAATAAGAFVLTENSLYTLEGWQIFLKHLTQNGVLSFSRWYYRDGPGEIYRLTSLASKSLMQLGINNPRNHMIIVRHLVSSKGDVPDGVGTLLVNKTPFSSEDLSIIEDVAQRLRFDVVLSPRAAMDTTLSTIASGKNLDQFVAKFPMNISAPSDDNPFFFHLLRVGDTFGILDKLPERGPIRSNMMAVFILYILFIVVVLLTLICIVLPLVLTTKKIDLQNSLPYFIYFSAIGLGFMLIEISLMQKLIIFLGHPTYSLSVVLFALLLSSSLGSYSTQKTQSLSRLLMLLVALVVFEFLAPIVIRHFGSATTSVRIIISVLLLFPLGFFMGMAFPLGMKFASEKSTKLTPWLWGINGAMSVCASVLAVVIALNWGISRHIGVVFFVTVYLFSVCLW